MQDKQIPNYQISPRPDMSCPPHMQLARAYVPWQIFGRTYPPGEALMRGTLFPDLYWPYKKHHCQREV